MKIFLNVNRCQGGLFTRELLSNIVGLLISSNIGIWVLSMWVLVSLRVLILYAHMRQNGKKIKLDTTAYPIPWYEPFSFYAEHTHAVKAFLK